MALHSFKNVIIRRFSSNYDFGHKIIGAEEEWLPGVKT